MKPIAIFVAGDPVPEAAALRGGFAAMIRRQVGQAYTGEWLDVDLRTAESLPTPTQFAGVIVTGSASSVVDREAWTLRGEEHLRTLIAAQVPVLGICYGHQMLGQALGGQVQRNPRGREIGTVEVTRVVADSIVGSATPMIVQATHVDSVVELPPGATVLAHSALDPHAAVRFAPSAWGVQFHPEFDVAVMRAYIQSRREQLEIEQLQPSQLLTTASETPEGPRILQRFIELVRVHRVP